MFICLFVTALQLPPLADSRSLFQRFFKKTVIPRGGMPCAHAMLRDDNARPDHRP
jgi:hypothetical protein